MCPAMSGLAMPMTSAPAAKLKEQNIFAAGRQQWRPAVCFGRSDVQDLLTPPLLKAAMPQASEHNVMRFVPELVKTMAHYNITGTLRMAHFLAQVAQESGQLSFSEELASGAAYEGRADLGNVEPGDGVRFKGRGLIQITGRSNYRAYSHACGQELLSGNNPLRLATDPALAADVAGWFWQVHKLNALADSDDVERITRRINGGLNGLAERQTFLAQTKAAIGHAEHTTTTTAHTSGPAPLEAVPAVVQISAAASATRTAPTPVTGTAVPKAESASRGVSDTIATAPNHRQYRSAA